MTMKQNLKSDQVTLLMHARFELFHFMQVKSCVLLTLLNLN